MDGEDIEPSIYQGLLVVSCSAVGCWGLNKILDHGFIPKSAKHKSWRFKNVVISWLHAIIAGIWSLSCFYADPGLAEDLISKYSSFSLNLVSFSVGYFIFDAADMLIYNWKKESFELVGHHVVVIACFGVAVIQHLYVGYAVVALIVEVNSVFLHLRQILQICGFQKNSSIYRLNSLINLGTFIAFRIATLAWMTRWLVMNRDAVPLLAFTIGSIGMAVMTVMNIILFFRLIIIDFLLKRKDYAEESKG